MTLHRREGHTALPVPSTEAERNAKSAVVYRLGGRTYAMKTVPQCKVCQSPYRVEIERALLRSYGYTAIHRSLPEQGQSDLSIRNIQEHASRHLPLDEHVRRAVIEARAREVGASVEDSEGALADHITMAKVGIQKVFQGMADGRLEPDIKDGIAFANLLLKVDEQAGEGVDEEVMFRGFMVYLKAIRANCTPDQVRAIGSQIATDPMMRALLAKAEQGIVEGSAS